MYLYSTVLYHDCALSHFPPLSSSTFYKFDFFIDLIDFYPFFFLSIFGFFQQTIALWNGIKSNDSPIREKNWMVDDFQVFPPLDGLNFFCNVPKSFDWSFLERCSTLRAGGVTSFFLLLCLSYPFSPSVLIISPWKSHRAPRRGA